MTSILIVIAFILTITIIISMYLYIRVNREVRSRDVLSSELVQVLFEIMGSNHYSTDEKIKECNGALIHAYGIDYSSIVLFDGNKNIVKASNVEQIYQPSIAEIAKDNMFKGNISRDTAKYITTTPDKTLLYKSAIERNIRSVLMIPICYQSGYFGYLMLEDTSPNAFDSMEKEDISKLKGNIGVFLENVQFQSTIEVAETIDKQTGFFNNMYLYSNTRTTLNEYDNSALILVSLKGLPDINEQYNRNIGNTLLIKLANVTKEICSKDTIMIRYSGLRFLIIVPGYTSEKVHPIAERILSRYKTEYVYFEDEMVTLDTQMLLHTFKKQSNIEMEVQKMVSYLDRMKDINTMKII